MNEGNLNNKVVLFGAGKIGRKIKDEYGIRVAYFIDNNAELWGTTIDGIDVKSLQDYKNDSNKYLIIITCKERLEIERQLKKDGIYNYKMYNNKLYSSTTELIYNPYQNTTTRDTTEEVWNDNLQKNKIREKIFNSVEQLQNMPLDLEHVEIETINRCNGNCDFCPVSKKNDSREYKEMSDQLFEKIIFDLEKMKYDGKLALFSNNEPFLDKKILERHKFAREHLPHARMHLFTNGTLLNLERFIELVKYLDELVIDNYQQELKLIKPCEEIVKYCEEHTELKEKVTIILRKPHEILSTRGGEAPNRKIKISYSKDRCILPYKQLIIRPDGKVSLCCNDPLGKITLGDLTKDSILDVWNNEQFQMIRKCLYEGRGTLKHCEYCDVFHMG